MSCRTFVALFAGTFLRTLSSLRWVHLPRTKLTHPYALTFNTLNKDEQEHHTHMRSTMGLRIVCGLLPAVFFNAVQGAGRAAQRRLGAPHSYSYVSVVYKSLSVHISLSRTLACCWACEKPASKVGLEFTLGYFCFASVSLFFGALAARDNKSFPYLIAVVLGVGPQFVCT